MYRRSTGRILTVSKDLMKVKVKLPISYKNRNYVNSIFGGSLFSAVDPIPMVQLINIIGDNYVVWDKSAEIHFKIPVKETLHAEFIYTEEYIESIKNEKLNYKIMTERLFHINGTPREDYVPTHYIIQTKVDTDEFLAHAFNLINSKLN